MWFALTALSVVFVAVDIRKTPESPVLKWGFVLLTAYTGPVGAFLYVLGCREPLPGLHEQYTSAHWRQTLGSTMHCVAGDGLGILAGAVIGGVVHMTKPAEIVLEYVLGFGFGWTIFQALFMKGSAGGSFRGALAKTFVPELVSMNYLMAAMVVVMTIGMKLVPDSGSPVSMGFWFVMSMALLAGFIAAFPANAWLVSRHLKHGMMTVRPASSATRRMVMPAHDSGANEAGAATHGGAHKARAGGHPGGVAPVSRPAIAGAIAASFVALAAGLFVAFIAGEG